MRENQPRRASVLLEKEADRLGEISRLGANERNKGYVKHPEMGLSQIHVSAANTSKRWGGVFYFETKNSAACRLSVDSARDVKERISLWEAKSLLHQKSRVLHVTENPSGCKGNCHETVLEADTDVAVPWQNPGQLAESQARKKPRKEIFLQGFRMSEADSI